MTSTVPPDPFASNALPDAPTVLVVDASAVVQAGMRQLLASRYRVDFAPDGEAALAQIARHRPDLVIADLTLPRLDGIGLLRRLRNDDGTRALPVILLSARDDEDARIEALLAGASDVPVKPISGRELLARVEAQIDLARRRHETQAAVESIIEGIADPFFALDRDWRFVFVNRRAHELWRKQRADLIGRDIRDVFPDQIGGDAHRMIQRAFTEGQPVISKMYSRLLGQWIEASVYPHPTGAAIYLRDVTQRQQIEDALREAEERLRLTIDSAKDYAIFSVDPEGVVISWNSGAERVFGYAEDEIIGVDGSILYTAEDRDDHIPQRELQRAVENSYAENERWHLRKDGSRLFASGMVRPIYDDSGALRGFAKVARDMTARHLAEQRTRVLQALTAELSTELSPDAMADAVIRAVHDAVPDTLASGYLLSADGQTLQRIAGDLLEFLAPAVVPLSARTPVADAVRDRAPLLVADRDALRKLYPSLAGSGHGALHGLFCLPLSPTPDHTIGGFAVGLLAPRPFDADTLAILTTIAHLCAQALQRALLFEAERQARRAAEDASAMKVRFLGMISHELRTPLASIKGFASTLLADDVAFTPDRQRQFLSVIDAEADRLSALVDQLLDLSRLQSGTLRIERRPESLAAIVRTASAQLHTLTASHRLLIDLPDSLPPILADAQRIAQVLVNLVGNSVKFSSPGTTITLRARALDLDVQIDVADEGIGIRPDSREAVFEAFRQDDHPSPGQQLGAGLGLAICKSIVDTHGGRIWVQDAPAGTTISLLLPAAPHD